MFFSFRRTDKLDNKTKQKCIFSALYNLNTRRWIRLRVRSFVQIEISVDTTRTIRAVRSTVCALFGRRRSLKRPADFTFNDTFVGETRHMNISLFYEFNFSNVICYVRRTNRILYNINCVKTVPNCGCCRCRFEWTTWSGVVKVGILVYIWNQQFFFIL